MLGFNKFTAKICASIQSFCDEVTKMMIFTVVYYREWCLSKNKGGEKMKKLISLLVAAVMMMCFSVSAFALFEDKPAVPVDPEAPYLYTHSISADLYISGGKATCSSKVKGINGKATKIEVTHYLQKMVSGYWTRVDTKTKTFYSYNADYTTTCSGLPSSPYRLSVVAKVYSGDDYEEVSYCTADLYY